MISPAQIRAARALIGWSQQDVAETVRMTSAALSRLESGQTKGRAKTLERLEDIFVQAGVEFLSGDGVRLRQKSVGIVQHDGPDSIQKMQDDIYVTMMSSSPREMYLNGVDERKFSRSSPAYLDKQKKRLQAAGIKQKILLQDKDRYFIMPPEVATYRWVEPGLFGAIPNITYGSKVAIIFWGPPTQVVIMESALLAETYRKQFSILWRAARAVPFTPREIREICQENIMAGHRL
jgi:transcriptional regulator with XRE-family HTH domain